MTQLTLARPDDIDRLARMVADFHAEKGIEQADAARRAALMPLLEGSPHGAVYLIGPGRAPIGYLIVGFGWSVELGGIDGSLDEFYIRSGVRGRGIGTEVLTGLPRALAGAGLKALHLEVAGDDERLQRLYARLGFRPRERCLAMTLRL